MKLSYEPVLMAEPKPLLTKFDIHHALESCVLSLVKFDMKLE